MSSLTASHHTARSLPENNFCHSFTASSFYQVKLKRGKGGVISGIKPQVSSVRKQRKHVKNAAPRPPTPQRLVLTPSSVYLVERDTKILLVALQYICLSLGKCLLAFTHTHGAVFLGAMGIFSPEALDRNFR